MCYLSIEAFSTNEGHGMSGVHVPSPTNVSMDVSSFGGAQDVIKDIPAGITVP